MKERNKFWLKMIALIIIAIILEIKVPYLGMMVLAISNLLLLDLLIKYAYKEE